jgi:hypothetical protein
MPDYVLKNKSKDVGAYVLSLPEGATEDDLQAALAHFEPGGWSLDKKTDPADVLPPEQPTVPASATPSKETK